MSKRGRYEKVKPKKKGGKILLIILCCVLVLLIGVGVAGVTLYKSMVKNIDYVTVESQDATMSDELIAMMGNDNPAPSTVETEEATTEATIVETTEPRDMVPEDILNVLVIGQSYREGEDSRLADTMILVTVNKYTKQITLTSFIRDAYVDLPNYMGHTCGWNRMNTNYALGYAWGNVGGAMEMTNLAIKNNFGIEVDYDVEVGFEAFELVIDILGGVEIELNEAEVEYINYFERPWNQVVEVGVNRLNGSTALEYARMRKAEGDNDSDIKRTERQRKLIIALFKQIATMNINTIRDIANEVMPLIKTNMPEEKITECLIELLPLMMEMSIESGTCPARGTDWPELKELPDGPAWVQCFSSAEQKAIFMPITEGYAP